MLETFKKLFDVRIKRIDYFVQTSFLTAGYLYLSAMLNPESLEVALTKAQSMDFLLLALYLLSLAYSIIGRLHDMGKSADQYFSFCAMCFISLGMHAFITTPDPGDTYNMIVVIVDTAVSCGFFGFLVYLLFAKPNDKHNQYGKNSAS